MTIPKWFLSVVCAALFAVGAWMITAMIDVRERIVRIETKLGATIATR